MNRFRFCIRRPMVLGLLLAFLATLVANASEKLEVRVGETVEIASSSGYCYYPTVHRFQNGDVFATVRMSADDTIPESECSAYSISTDRGKTWGSRCTIGGSAAVDSAYSYSPLKDGSIMVLGTGYCTVEPYPAGQASQFHIAVTTFSRGGKDVTIVRDAVLRLTDPANAKRVDRAGEMKRERTFEVVPWGAIVDANANDLLVAAYLFTERDPRYRRLVLLRSTDAGRTWAQYSTVAAIEPSENPPSWWGTEGPNEAAIVRTKDNRLLTIFRTGGSGANLGQTRSADGGKTWTRPEPSGIKGVAPRLRLLSNGVLALSTGRPAPVSLMFSLDGNGQKWSHATEIFGGKEAFEKGKPKTTTHYADFVEVEPGKILIVYDSVPYGWRPIPPTDRDSRNRVLGTFVEVRRQ